jgi:hypothetical protein
MRYSIYDQHEFSHQPYGPHRDSKEYQFDSIRYNANIIESGYFSISPEYIQNFGNLPLDQGGPGAENIVDDLYRGVMWQVLITNYNENHSEGVAIHNTFEDVFIGFSTGSIPVAITISGYISISPDYNSKMDFLTYYNLLLRGYRQNKHKIPILFTLKDTYMHLRLSSLDVLTDVSMPDFVVVNLTGTGYKYFTIAVD